MSSVEEKETVKEQSEKVTEDVQEETTIEKVIDKEERKDDSEYESADGLEEDERHDPDSSTSQALPDQKETMTEKTEVDEEASGEPIGSEDGVEGEEEEEILDEEDEEDDETESAGEAYPKREEGDGEESEKKEKVLDHDEDRRDPQYIPKRGVFYEHDDRTLEEEGSEVKEVVKEPPKKAGGKGCDAKERWGHDLYNEAEQSPKSREEIMDIYGYDIRNEEGPPKARRRRRYGKGPNRYQRNWEDEEAYVKSGSHRGGRGGGHFNHTRSPSNNEHPRNFIKKESEFPALSHSSNKSHRNFSGQNKKPSQPNDQFNSADKSSNDYHSSHQEHPRERHVPHQSQQRRFQNRSSKAGGGVGGQFDKNPSVSAKDKEDIAELAQHFSDAVIKVGQKITPNREKSQSKEKEIIVEKREDPEVPTTVVNNSNGNAATSSGGGSSGGGGGVVSGGGGGVSGGGNTGGGMSGSSKRYSAQRGRRLPQSAGGALHHQNVPPQQPPPQPQPQIQVPQAPPNYLQGHPPPGPHGFYNPNSGPPAPVPPPQPTGPSQGYPQPPPPVPPPQVVAFLPPPPPVPHQSLTFVPPPTAFLPPPIAVQGPTEVYQGGGITYYNTQNQVQRSTPSRRVKLAIPIVAPNESMQ